MIKIRHPDHEKNTSMLQSGGAQGKIILGAEGAHKILDCRSIGSQYLNVVARGVTCSGRSKKQFAIPYAASLGDQTSWPKSVKLANPKKPNHTLWTSHILNSNSNSRNCSTQSRASSHLKVSLWAVLDGVVLTYLSLTDWNKTALSSVCDVLAQSVR